MVRIRRKGGSSLEEGAMLVTALLRAWNTVQTRKSKGARKQLDRLDELCEGVFACPGEELSCKVNRRDQWLRVVDDDNLPDSWDFSEHPIETMSIALSNMANMPMESLDDDAFIGEFIELLQAIFYPLGRITMNIANFADMFVEFVNSKTRPGYMVKYCRPKRHAHADRELGEYYTCGRAISYIDGAKEGAARILLHSTVSEDDSSADLSDLEEVQAGGRMKKGGRTAPRAKMSVKSSKKSTSKSKKQKNARPRSAVQRVHDVVRVRQSAKAPVRLR